MYEERIWNILKPLCDEIKIYQETVDSGIENLPLNYIVYVIDVTNNAVVYGDGFSLLRESYCEINVFTEGTANKSNNKYFVDKVEELLNQNKINYNKINLGFNSGVGKSQVTFDFRLV